MGMGAVLVSVNDRMSRRAINYLGELNRAARDGLRIGDRLVAVAGIPFVPMKPSSFPGLRDKMIAAGEVTFCGPRGLFRWQTEITIRIRQKVEEPNKRTTDSSAIDAK